MHPQLVKGCLASATPPTMTKAFEQLNLSPSCRTWGNCLRCSSSKYWM